MIKYDLQSIIGTIRHTLIGITQLPDDHVFYVSNQDIPAYPYLTLEVTQPHVTEQTGQTRENEIYHMVMNVNTYATDPITSTQLADDISTQLYDPYYRDDLKQNGITISDISVNGASNDNFFGNDTVYVQNLQLTLRFTRYYISKINHIQNTNLGGAK